MRSHAISALSLFLPPQPSQANSTSPHFSPYRVMKNESKCLISCLSAAALLTSAAHGATIHLDLASNNAGAISLDAGDNDFSYTGFSVEYLIVGGGGGGGGGIGSAGGGGGGGAGGLLEGTTTIAGAQNIVVGAGGAGGASGNTVGSTFAGNKGSNSSAFSLTAEGGGFGGRFDSGGGAGGSGGGAAARGSLTGGTGGTATAGQGSDGGSRVGTSKGASSGGGAGGAGIDGGSNNTGRNGGAAVTRNITGEDVLYAGGGAGGGDAGGTSDTGGSGGAGSGNGSSGTANTGGGGGGGGTTGGDGGAGGSGIVVVRYSGSQVLAGGIVSTVGGDTVHQFITTGTSTLDLHSATVAGDISGSGNLIWDKTGVLTLSGTSTYTGTTTIDFGSLLLLGSIQSTSNLLFANNGFLDLGSTGWINVLQSNFSISAAEAAILNDQIVGDQSLNVTTFNDGFNLYTQIAVIPEPSVALLSGLGLFALLRRRR